MAADENWYFSKEQLANTPSRKFGFDADKELSSRQQAANFIQDMGQRLQVYPFFFIELCNICQSDLSFDACFMFLVTVTFLDVIIVYETISLELLL